MNRKLESTLKELELKTNHLANIKSQLSKIDQEKVVYEQNMKEAVEKTEKMRKSNLSLKNKIDSLSNEKKICLDII